MPPPTITADVSCYDGVIKQVRVTLWRESVKLTGELPVDATSLLEAYGCRHTAIHSARVADKAAELALRFGVNEVSATTAGWLHDISAIVPTDDRAEVAESCGVEVLAEERVFPMIVHQKLSAFIASEVFGVRLPEILSAIGCHTTLKSGASRLDKVVFVADKLAWDGQGDPPYLNQVISGLDESLELGVFRYLDHLWCRRHELRVIHPWLKAAHAELLSALSR